MSTRLLNGVDWRSISGLPSSVVSGEILSSKKDRLVGIRIRKAENLLPFPSYRQIQMETEPFNFDNAPEECPNCGFRECLAVESLVFEVAHHSDGKHYFKNGGDVLGELCVQCSECDHTIWTADALPEPEPVDVEKWETGEACPSCDSPYINEIHVDWKYRAFNGTHLSDGDRTHTIRHQCNNCGDILSTHALSDRE